MEKPCTTHATVFNEINKLKTVSETRGVNYGVEMGEVVAY